MKRMMFSIGMLAMALAFGMAGCLLDLGVPRRNDGQETQPKAGVLTVIGAKDGVSYEAEVYDYPDDDVADAADLADLMSRFEIAGTGLDMPGEEALEIELLMPDGEYFTADGDFLVVLKDEKDAGAPLRYKAAVPFAGGSATLKYSTMKTATIEPSVSIYTVTFYLNDESGKAHASQTVAHNGKAVPAAKPTRTDYDFDNWYTPNAEAPYDFNSPVTAGLDLLAKWKPLTFAAVIADMAENNGTAAKTYSLSSGNNVYNAAVRLTAGKNSPASVVIDGGGTIVTGNANRITIGSGVTLTLKNITLKTLPLSVAAGGTLVLDNGAVVTANNSSGVAVQANGVFTMNGGTISGNTAGEGAGVHLAVSGVFTMNGGTISGNSGWNGGGVYTGGNFNMTGGEITNNEAGSSGGAVFVCGSTSVFTMSNGEISGNYADYGGGVAIWEAGKFNMSSGFIKNNRVEFGGGGVLVQANSTFNMTGGEITGNIMDRVNYAPSYGFSGGVYIAGGILTGNPRIGNPVTSGSGSGWIYGNTPTDVDYKRG